MSEHPRFLKANMLVLFFKDDMRRGWKLVRPSLPPITFSCPPRPACSECPECPGPDYSLVGDYSLRPLPLQERPSCLVPVPAVTLFRCASFPLDCLFFCVGVCRREGPQRMQEGKEECRRPCSRTSVTGHFRAPVPETVANFLGLHGVPTLLLPVSALLFSCTARHANHLVQNYKATQLYAFA